jgi:RNA polymerase sigma-70 factor (ECF subfamily)
MREDLRFAMPPDPGVWVTAKSAMDAWVSGGFGGPGYDDWRCIVTTVNRMPAVVEYLRTPDHPVYRLFAIDVLHIVDGKVAELTGFLATDKPWLGLPPTL